MTFTEINEELNNKLAVINGTMAHLDFQIKKMKEERDKLEDARDCIENFQENLGNMMREITLFE